MSILSPWLTQAEIDELCAPLKQYSAQIRYLRSLSLTVSKKPCGQAIVMRTHADAVLSGRQAANGGLDQAGATQIERARPDIAGLIAAVRGNRGTP